MDHIGGPDLGPTVETNPESFDSSRLFVLKGPLTDPQGYPKERCHILRLERCCCIRPFE